MTAHAASLVVFDAYGTLLDVNAAVARHAQAVGPDAARLSELWRSKQLEYTWVTSLMQRYEPFWTLTERALEHALARLPSVPAAMRAPLLEAYRALDPYPEAADVLRALRERGARTAVLSNGDRAMLDAAFGSAGLVPLLDAIVSVDEVRVFKTAPEVYALVTRRFNVAAADVLFVSLHGDPRTEYPFFLGHADERGEGAGLQDVARVVAARARVVRTDCDGNPPASPPKHIYTRGT